MKLPKTISFGLLLFVLAFVFATPTLAQGRGQGQGLTRAQAATVTGTTRSCEVRLTSVKKRMSQLVDLSENMFRVFDSISTRVQTFYTDKVLPTGTTVANYQALLDDIQTKKTAVSDAIASANADVNSFSCIGDVRALYNEFRLDMQAVKTALKNYRTSVRNLIVAVHSAMPEETPTATVTP